MSYKGGTTLDSEGSSRRVSCELAHESPPGAADCAPTGLYRVVFFLSFLLRCSCRPHLTTAPLSFCH